MHEQRKTLRLDILFIQGYVVTQHSTCAICVMLRLDSVHACSYRRAAAEHRIAEHSTYVACVLFSFDSVFYGCAHQCLCVCVAGPCEENVIAARPLCMNIKIVYG